MKQKQNILKGSRVYLSGPMDFVASRAKESKFGWRNRVSEFLKSYGVTIFDPWNKPDIYGLHEYGKEDENVVKIRESWTYSTEMSGIKKRSNCVNHFWETMHIDLRMVDISDFIIAYCPTNIYSVGTVHEIVVARQQHKPVLFVSPPVIFKTLKVLEKELKQNRKAIQLLEKLKIELPVKENEEGIPSLWYMPLIGSENFFDGFRFNDARYRKKFKWDKNTELDEREKFKPPKRPLLPFIESLAAGQLPKKWNHDTQKFEIDDDWLLMEKSLESYSTNIKKNVS